MKRIISIAAVAALIFAFGCTEEPLDKDPQEGGNPEGEVPAEGFYLKANIGQNADTQLSGTKTTFDAQNGYKVAWEESDELAVYIKGGETDGLYKFTKNAGENTFSTDEFIPDADTDYTYYVVYPFTESVSASDLTAQVTIASGTYDAADPDGNIDTPLYGKTQGAGAECPEVTLSHLASVIAVEFVNGTGADMTVTEVSIEAADAALSGTFSLDLETGDITSAEVVPSGTVLTVNAAAGESAVYYLACAPYTGALTVNVAAGGTYSESKSGVNFVAGKFYNTTVTAAGEPEHPESVESLSISGAAAGGTPITVEKTLEDETLYAWKGELQAGEFKINVNDTDAFLSVTDANFEGTPSGYSIAFDGGSYTVPAAGSYRIIVDTEAATVEVRDEEHDLKNKSVSYNNTVDNVNPYTQEVTVLWMWGGFNSFSTESGMKTGFDSDYTLTQSMADPCLFVYHGEVLPRLSAVDANNNNERKTGFIKFLVSNIENNVYAYGSTADAKRNDHSGYLENIVLGETQTLVEGQGDNRYAYFIIPENVNYVEVDIENLTVIFDNRPL